jgi:hypothetical protein
MTQIKQIYTDFSYPEYHRENPEILKILIQTKAKTISEDNPLAQA